MTEHLHTHVTRPTHVGHHAGAGLHRRLLGHERLCPQEQPRTNDCVPERTADDTVHSNSVKQRLNMLVIFSAIN